MKGMISLATAALGIGTTAQAQVILSGTSYSQDFDTIPSGLPAGWSVRTGATASSLGGAVSPVATPVSWGTSTGNFNNYASSHGLSSSASSATQLASVDRALGVRQTGGFGDPGAAFVLQVAQTAGFRDFTLSFEFQTLSEQGRTTVWTVDYALGATPVSFTSLGTITQDTWGSTLKSYLLPVAVDDQSDNLWIRIAALSTATGTGNRDSFAIDDFALQFSAIPEPAASAFAAGLGLAGVLVWRRRN